MVGGGEVIGPSFNTASQNLVIPAWVNARLVPPPSSSRIMEVMKSRPSSRSSVYVGVGFCDSVIVVLSNSGNGACILCGVGIVRLRCNKRSLSSRLRDGDYNVANGEAAHACGSVIPERRGTPVREDAVEQRLPLAERTWLRGGSVGAESAIESVPAHYAQLRR